MTAVDLWNLGQSYKMNIKSAKYVKDTFNPSQNIAVNVKLDNQELSIPINGYENHPDWIALQEWVAEGNKIEEAD